MNTEAEAAAILTKLWWDGTYHASSEQATKDIKWMYSQMRHHVREVEEEVFKEE